MKLFGIEILSLVIFAEKDNQAFIVTERDSGGYDIQILHKAIMCIVISF